MLKIVIIDDESPAVDRLNKLLQKSGMAEVVKAFTNPLESISFVRDNHVDAVFLDIEMPEINGLELATQLIDIQPALEIVFITAYKNYAVDAFELNALDYILKPFSLERLKTSLRRIHINTHHSGTILRLKVSMFGRMQITTGGEPIHFRTQKAEELFAYLLDNDGEFVSRNSIIDSLWLDFPGDKAVLNFHSTIYYIKKALFPYIKTSILEHYRGSYRILMDHIESDSQLIREAAKTALDNNLEAYEGIKSAIELYTGRYLGAHDYPWAYQRGLYYERKATRIVLALTDLALRYKTRDAAVEILSDFLQLLPENEEVNLRLVKVLLSMNRPTQARQYYDQYKNLLHIKYDLEPSLEFRQLFRH
ncbi:MAG: response regulator [Candidatus Cloacimonetes bacterium]|nr:response regulator [Candidatus Cloacimonadota bacterium]